jgi:hypothetical protein
LWMIGLFKNYSMVLFQKVQLPIRFCLIT